MSDTGTRSCPRGSSPSTCLNGPVDVEITTIGGSTYAVVTGTQDDGVSIIDISTPASPVYVSELEDGTDTGKCTAANGERCLDQTYGVAIATIGDSTYVVAVGYRDNGIAIIDISTPASPVYVSQLEDEEPPGTNIRKCSAANGDS